MKKLKRELNVLSPNCNHFFLNSLVAEDFETLIKHTSNTNKKSQKNSPMQKS